MQSQKECDACFVRSFVHICIMYTYIREKGDIPTTSGLYKEIFDSSAYTDIDLLLLASRCASQASA
jgi:hypothetical protein